MGAGEVQEEGDICIQTAETNNIVKQLYSIFFFF